MKQQQKNQSKFSFRIFALSIAFCVALTSFTSLNAQVLTKDGDWPTPLLDGDPFDVIYLDDQSENAIIRIIPTPDLKLPLRGEGQFRFEYREDSEFILQVPIGNIENYVTFNDLLLEEAEDFVSQRRYADALRNLLHVYDNGGASDSSLKNRLQDVLFNDAAANLADGNYELSLSIFEDLYKKDPTFRVPGIPDTLKETIEKCYDGILQKRFESGDAEFIKASLVAIERQYGDEMKDFVAGWNDKFHVQAQKVLKDAAKAAAKGAAKKEKKKAAGLGVGCAELRLLVAPPGAVEVAVDEVKRKIDPFRTGEVGSVRVGLMRLTVKCFTPRDV